MEEIIVGNLETNIESLKKFLSSESEKISNDRKSEVTALIAGLEKLKTDPIDLLPVAALLEKILEKISEEKEADEKPQETLDAIKEVKKSIDNKPVPSLDLTELEEILEMINYTLTNLKPEKVKFPDTYPLPQEQLEVLTPKKDEKLTFTLDELIEVISKLRSDLEEGIKTSGGGGGPDVVGIKNEDANGRPIRINVPTEETQLSLAGLVSVPYDTVQVNYTDDTKEVISTIVYSKDGIPVATITATQPTTSSEVYTNL